MDFNTRLRRVTDLFTEGTEVFLGHDPDGAPVLIWVNKLNSFETDEARRDGIVRRGVRMMELAKPDNPERQALEAEIALWSDEELHKNWVAQREEEIYLEVINDVEAREGWAEKLDQIRRLPQLLADAGAPDDDPRRTQLAEMQTEYLEAIREGQQEKQKQMLRDAADQAREDLQRSFYETWRQRSTLEEFMEERRISELALAMRVCDATPAGVTEGRQLWDHAGCSHQRMLPDRSLVRTLPPAVIEKVVEALEGLSMSDREAGNSDAPASSSASSEQSSASEAPSTPSSPIETPPAVPTT